MKKRIMCAIAVCVLCLSTLAACKDNRGELDDTTTPENTQVTVCGETDPGEQTTDGQDPANETGGQEYAEFDPLHFKAEAVGVGNVAVGKLVLSDSSDRSTPDLYDSSYMVDGVQNANGFSSVADTSRRCNHYFLIDLGKSYEISEVRLYPATEHESSFPSKINVLVSSDGSDYREVGAYSAGSTDSVGADGIGIVFQAQDARYVRFDVTGYGSCTDNASDGKSYRYMIGEAEVMGVVMSDENLSLGTPGMWMDTGHTGSFEPHYLVSEAAGREIEWFSSDDSVVSVDKTTGLITANSAGRATVYAFDGRNQTTADIVVKDDTPAFQIGIYYNANHGVVSETTADWLCDFGLDYIEIDHIFDSNGNNIQTWLVNRLAERGVGAVMFDNIRYSVLDLDDEAIRDHFMKYENTYGCKGFMIWDEPLSVAPYGRVTRILSDLGFDAIVNVNLSPENPGAFDEKIYEYMSAVGMEGIKYLTYDQYPYAKTGQDFSAIVYSSLDSMRRAGLAYHTDTGFYLQAFEGPATRKSSDSELLYNMSVGMAYGNKNFKWFLWFTPHKYFTDAILDWDSQKGDMYDGGVMVNSKIHAMSPYLANTDAIEVYHTDATPYTEAVPNDFIFQFDSGTSAIVTVFRDRTTAQNYIGIVNKRFSSADPTSIRFTYTGSETLTVINSDGETSSITATDGKFTVTLAPGDILLIKMDPDLDLLIRPDGNLALHAGVWASSSEYAGTTVSVYELVDGSLTGGCWRSAKDDGDQERSVTLLLSDQLTLSELTLYAYGSGDACPESVCVYVSSDHIEYRQVTQAVPITLDSHKSFTIELDQVQARYIKLVFGSSAPQIELAEIEIR